MANKLDRDEIDAHLFVDEAKLIRSLAEKAKLTASENTRVLEIAADLVQASQISAGRDPACRLALFPVHVELA